MNVWDSSNIHLFNISNKWVSLLNMMLFKASIKTNDINILKKQNYKL